MKFKVIETFSGIGAQNTALKNLKSKGILDYEIIGTSDWDVFAAQSYAAIHFPNYRNKIKTPIDEVLNSWIEDNTFSLDGSKPFLNTSTLKKEIKLDWYKAFKVANNIGTIVDSTSRIQKLIELNNGVDLLTYSFPCTDLSTAGNFHGFNEGIKAHTRSGLLLEIEKVIQNLNVVQEGERERERERERETTKNLLPKFLLLENVPNLVQKQHRSDFDSWLKQLSKLGYKTIWGMLYSSDFGMVQKRRRVYALSIYDPDNKIVSWNKTRNDLETVLKDIYNKKTYQPKNKQTIKKLIDFSNKDFEESLWAQIKDTPSRIRMIEASPWIDSNLKHIPTVTTKQDRLPNCGSVIFNNSRFDNKGISYTKRRFITPKEAYLLMGFSEKQYQNAKKEMLLVTKKYRAKTDNQAREKLYKQAGNSIAINAIEMVFYYMSTLEE